MLGLGRLCWVGRSGSTQWNNPTNLTDPTGFVADNGNGNSNNGQEPKEPEPKEPPKTPVNQCNFGVPCLVVFSDGSSRWMTFTPSGNEQGTSGTKETKGKGEKQATKSGDVIMTFLQKADEKLGEYKHFQILSPESFKSASEYYSAKLDETGNFGYAILTGLMSVIGDHPQEVGMILSMGKPKGDPLSKMARTEPTLPPKTIAEGGGIKIQHYTKSGDHGPAHLHVNGGGPETRIGQSGYPLKGNPPLTPAQQKLVDANQSTIRRAVNKMQRWFDYWRNQ